MKEYTRYLPVNKTTIVDTANKEKQTSVDTSTRAKGVEYMRNGIAVEAAVWIGGGWERKALFDLRPREQRRAILKAAGRPPKEK